MSTPTIWLSCGVLRTEMEELHRLGKIGGQLRFLDSMLHMVPEKLESTLIGVLEKNVPEDTCLVLVYGDCCSLMLDFVHKYRVSRVKSINCAQLLTGPVRYRQLMKDQAFLFLPEWALRWKEIMQTHLGLTSEVARELMTENRKELVYLDTGLLPVPHPALNDCSQYTGLPWRVESITLDHLLTELLEAQAVAQIRSEPKEKI